MASNGSTSQASVCGSTLALMDAGVPIKAPVAGIAMGLMSNADVTDYRILTDIAGIEDAFGDMDFKVAGTAEGVTAVQLDIKLSALPEDFMRTVFDQAKDARLKILQVMEDAIPSPREDVNTFAPKIHTLKIDPSKIGAVIGPGGKVINAIIERTGAAIDIEEDGSVFVGSAESEGVRQAIAEIEGLTKEVEVGEIYTGKVVRLMAFGAFVELLPGKDGLVHISELAEGRVDKVEDVVKVDDEVTVRVIDIDNLGRINLTMRDPEAVSGSVGISDENGQGSSGQSQKNSNQKPRKSRGGDRNNDRRGGAPRTNRKGNSRSW